MIEEGHYPHAGGPSGGLSGLLGAHTQLVAQLRDELRDLAVINEVISMRTGLFPSAGGAAPAASPRTVSEARVGLGELLAHYEDEVCLCVLGAGRGAAPCRSAW